MENSNKTSIRNAAELYNTLLMPQEVVNRLKGYVSKKNEVVRTRYSINNNLNYDDSMEDISSKFRKT